MRIVGLITNRLLSPSRRGRARNPFPTPLPQTFVDAKNLVGLGLHQPAPVHQPCTLRQKNQQQRSGYDLRPPEALACKKSAHKQRASVLPCRATLPEKSSNGCTRIISASCTVSTFAPGA